MVGLKRHFVKDTSSRDTARKFKQLEQKSRSVPELRRDLEQLGMQMVEAPTDYTMSRHFMDALKPKIAGGVVMRGLTLEKSVFNEIVQKAIDIEEAIFYKNKDDRYKNKIASSLSKQSTAKPYRAKAGTMKVPLKTLVPYKKPLSTTQKDIECHFCKQKGPISLNCPKKTWRTANIEPIEEVASKSEDRAEEVLSEEEYASAAENEEDLVHGEAKSADEVEDDHQSIEDWCATARPTEDYAMGKFQRVERIHPVDKANLEDWSDSKGYSESSFGLGMALHAVPYEEESPHALTASGTSSNDQVAYRHRATKQIGPLRIEAGPKRDFKHLGVIEGYMRINGHKVHVLLDGGSMLDLILANFAKVHQLKMFELKNLIHLQMAMSGSRSSIQYGAHAELKVGDLKQQRYFDVVNLDRYQVILGTPFLKEHKIMLNYAGSGSFKLGDQWFLVKEGDFGSPLSAPKGGEGATRTKSTSSHNKDHKNETSKGSFSRPAEKQPQH
jgi:hypothetical protein